MVLKPLEKEQFRKQHKQLAIQFVIKLQKSQELHKILIQTWSEMKNNTLDLIEKYVKKGIKIIKSRQNYWRSKIHIL